MSSYKTLKTFTSQVGRTFYYGNKISYSELKNLPYSEQNNFELIYNEEKQMKGFEQDELFNANDLEVSKED